MELRRHSCLLFLTAVLLCWFGCLSDTPDPRTNSTTPGVSKNTSTPTVTTTTTTPTVTTTTPTPTVTTTTPTPTVTTTTTTPTVPTSTPTPDVTTPTPTPDVTTTTTTPTVTTTTTTPTVTTTTTTPSVPTSTPTPDGTTPTPTPDVTTPTPTPTVTTTTPTPDVTTPTPTPDVTTSTPTPDVTTPSPTPDGTTPSPTPDVTTPSPTPDVTTPSPTPDGTTPSPTPDGTTPTPLLDATTDTQPASSSNETTAPSSSTEPSTTEPSTTEPSTTEPSTTEPSTTEPSTTEPSTTTRAETTGTSTNTGTTPSPTVMWAAYVKNFSVENNILHSDADIPFPYFDKVSTVINGYTNGYVAFDYDFRQPTAPLPTEWKPSPKLFAVYWADVEYVENSESHFYGYEDTTRLLNATVQSSLIEYVKKIVNETDFQPLYAIALTWVNVVPKPAKDFPNDKATFQLILATDSRVSVAIRTYEKVWANVDAPNRPYVTAAYTLANGKRSAPIDPSSGRGPEVIHLGTWKPNNESLNCVQLTQTAKAKLDASISLLSPCPCEQARAAQDQRYYLSGSCYQRVNADDDKLKQRCCYNDYGVLITHSKEAQIPESDDLSLKSAFKKCCDEESRLCDWFYKQFSWHSCEEYRTPFIAAGFGDPHIVTFDNNRFSFNRLGDFVLFRSEDGKVEIQGRTDISSNNETTIFVAIAVKVENNIHQFYVDNDNNFIVNNESETAGNATLKSSGFTIKIEVSGRALYYTIIADESDEKSSGLMGTFDRNDTNDFKFGNGSSLVGNVTQQSGTAINNFVLSWRIEENDTWIASPASTLDDVVDQSLKIPENTFEGIQEMLNETDRLTQADKLCGRNIFCLQEFYFSNDSAIRILDFDNAISERKEFYNKLPPRIQSQGGSGGFITINVTSKNTFKLRFIASSEAKYSVVSNFNNVSGFNLVIDTFTWNVSAGLKELRTLSYPQKLTFYVTDNGLSATYDETINLCLCESANQCLRTNTTNEGYVNSLQCNCTVHDGGQYCEEKALICDNCFNTSTCNNSQTDYCAACPDGYHGNGFICHDIDECTDNNGGCGDICTNTNGNFSCSCHDGYYLDGVNCIDTNECEKDYNYCNDSNKVCRNLPGSASCSCIPGMVGNTNCFRAPYAFIGEVKFIISLDEQIIGQFLVKTSEAFQGVGKDIAGAITDTLKLVKNFGDVYVNILLFTDFKNETTTKSKDDGKNSFEATATFVIYTSNSGVTAKNIRDALAKLTFANHANSNKFGDLGQVTVSPTFDDAADLCQFFEIHGCDNLTTTCQHKQHSTHCICHKGYTYTSQSLYFCRDIDECVETAKNCPEKAVCKNTVGDYECDCGSGKDWNTTDNTCVGDRCSANPCYNDGVCHMLNNKDFLCSCTYGWNGQDCSEEDTDARRWKVAVICVSVILGFCCLALFIIVIVVCIKQRRKGKQTSSMNNHYSEIKPLPRIRVSEQSSNEMEEKNGPGNAYSKLQASSASDKNSTHYSPLSDNGSRTVYNNAAFEPDIVARL